MAEAGDDPLAEPLIEKQDVFLVQGGIDQLVTGDQLEKPSNHQVAAHLIVGGRAWPSRKADTTIG